MTVVACEVGAGAIGAAAKQERIISQGAFSTHVATKIVAYKVGMVCFILRSFMECTSCAWRIANIALRLQVFSLALRTNCQKWLDEQKNYNCGD